MTDSGQHRLRLKLPSGAELEVEGGAEFVASERQEFMALHAHPASPTAAAFASSTTDPKQALSPQPAWESIMESKGHNLQLRAKFRADKTEKDACLVLLAASQALLRTAKPTAAQLARWLRLSGYPIGRVDRAIQEALDKGEILASGSRRARRYELSGTGLAKAHVLAYQLANLIKNPSSQQ